LAVLLLYSLAIGGYRIEKREARNEIVSRLNSHYSILLSCYTYFVDNLKFKIYNLKFRRSRPGFTFFEVIISVGILVILSSVVLQSFIVARNRENTRQASLNFIEQARHAQTQSLTGQIGDISIVGQYLEKDSRQTENRKYTLINNQVNAGVSFSPAQVKNYNDILVKKIETQVAGGSWTEVSSLIIGFLPPRGLVKFYNPLANGFEFTGVKFAKITLYNSNNEETRVLSLNNLGQMTLEKP